MSVVFSMIEEHGIENLAISRVPGCKLNIRLVGASSLKHRRHSSQMPCRFVCKDGGQGLEEALNSCENPETILWSHG